MSSSHHCFFTVAQHSFETKLPAKCKIFLTSLLKIDFLVNNRKIGKTIVLIYIGLHRFPCSLHSKSTMETIIFFSVGLVRNILR